MQTDGLSMGSPLAPLMADWFVAKIENKLFKHLKLNRPKFYKRYVDDIFAVFESTTERDVFYNILNNRHPNLSFTMETTDGRLPFLDVSVSINNGVYETQVYRKPTNTCVMMNFNSEAPLKWKKSLIRGLLIRAYRNSSHHHLFEMETRNITEILRRNAYPVSFIDQEISRFISELGIRKEDFINQKNKEQRKQLVVTEFDDVYMKIPYFGKPSIKLHRTIHQRMLQYKLWVKAAYKTTKVASYFSLKSKMSNLFKSNVVYKFTCSRDESIAYIGETQRCIFERIADHTDKTKESAVFDHMVNCTECCNSKNISDSFKIIQQCNSTNIYGLESLLIAKINPTLNIQLGANKGTKSRLSIYTNY